MVIRRASPDRRRPHRRSAILLALALVGAACASDLEISAEPTPSDAAPDPVAGSDPAPDPEPPPEDPEPPPEDPGPPPEDLAPDDDPPPEHTLDEAIELTLADLEAYWVDELPLAYGIVFEPVAVLTGYRPSDESTLPLCGGEVGPADIYADNAFYCPLEDTIAWDEEQLFPDLDEAFGDFSASLVLAHEYGHAVQSRALEDAATIFLELQADCLAGAWAGTLTERGSVLRPTKRDLEQAIGGYLDFRDPLGTPASDPFAHGSAFDRVSAFAQGFGEGSGACVDYDTDPPAVADIQLTAEDIATGGDLVLEELVPLLLEDIDVYWTEASPALLGVDYPDPDVVPVGPDSDLTSCDGQPADFADLAVLCPTDAVIVYDEPTLLPELWGEVGDVAAGYVLIHAHSQALLVEAGVAPDATMFNQAADCLSGAFLADMFLGNTVNLRLSAGDLDEAVVGLVLYEPPRPGFAPATEDAIFDRVQALRRGFQRGVGACLEG